jgi:hypothetical protein
MERIRCGPLSPLTTTFSRQRRQLPVRDPNAIVTLEIINALRDEQP